MSTKQEWYNYYMSLGTYQPSSAEYIAGIMSSQGKDISTITQTAPIEDNRYLMTQSQLIEQNYRQQVLGEDEETAITNVLNRETSGLRTPGIENPYISFTQDPIETLESSLIIHGMDPAEAEDLAEKELGEISEEDLRSITRDDILEVSEKEGSKASESTKKETDILSFLNNLLTTNESTSSSPNLSQLATTKSQLNPVQMLAMKLQNIDKDLAEWIWNMSELPLEQIAEQVEFRYNLSLANQYERRNYNGMGLQKLQNPKKLYRKKKYPKNYSQSSVSSRYPERY